MTSATRSARQRRRRCTYLATSAYAKKHGNDQNESRNNDENINRRSISENDHLDFSFLGRL
ncbi:MAG TPA: hypothetical protein VFH99_02660 [Candidatus Saccharimonadales bacterium]|nr:hypothetical protein [Candidatus Saccharimonadales bacterium]